MDQCFIFIWLPPLSGSIHLLVFLPYGWCSCITIFTVAINIVFFPMHALGISGMPRRIPDFADGYASWNSFMTIGTFLTVISLFIFLYIVAFTVFNPRPVDANVRARWQVL